MRAAGRAANIMHPLIAAALVWATAAGVVAYMGFWGKRNEAESESFATASGAPAEAPAHRTAA